jgi:uncharacterized protein (DUF2236 family)
MAVREQGRIVRAGGPLPLPSPLLAYLDRIARAQLQAPGLPRVDFTEPAGEPALAPPDSVSWQVFRNPVSLLVGGIAAVILELAEPRVRTGIWDHTSFRSDPVTRLRRTGLAAMVTVYGARSTAERMIAGVRRMHERVSGETPSGAHYRASDPELLRWVQATAAFGFMEAYRAYVRPLSLADQDRFYAEGVPASHLYGATGVPTSADELRRLFATMLPFLEPSPVIFEFLEIMNRAPILPSPLRPLQRLLVRAAIEVTPEPVRTILGLDHRGLRLGEAAILSALARAADRVFLESAPAVQACIRLNLPAEYLYRRL